MVEIWCGLLHKWRQKYILESRWSMLPFRSMRKNFTKKIFIKQKNSLENLLKWNHCINSAGERTTLQIGVLGSFEANEIERERERERDRGSNQKSGVHQGRGNETQETRPTMTQTCTHPRVSTCNHDNNKQKHQAWRRQSLKQGDKKWEARPMVKKTHTP